MQLVEARSLLFIPATAPHMLAKSTQRGADALVIDLEDAVPMNRKIEARQLMVQAVERLAGQIPVLVRVNAPSDILCEDVAALPLSRIKCVLLPKAESAEQVKRLASLLEQKSEKHSAPTPIAALIETPLGVVRAEQISTAHPSVLALGFGGEDYAAEMGIAPKPESLLWPAQAVANCARAFHLACWGLPGSVAEIEDMQAFSDLVHQARRIGFSGTVCIHPRQVEFANKGFSPTDQELAWARKVVAAAQSTELQDKGVTIIDGRMVDKPIVERAQRWLKSADA